MGTAFRSTTPPPPSSIRTPATPRFGFHDDYAPYSPRKSKRLSQLVRTAQTPPPQMSANQLDTPRTSKKRNSANGANIPSSPSSPQTATKKKTLHYPSTMGGRRISGALNAEGTASAATALGLPKPRTEVHRATTAVHNNGMLPTPDKTPKKAPTEVDPAIRSVARNIFRTEAVDDLMPSPRKSGRKKYKGFTLDSFEAEDEEQSISIFTDSHDRVPEVDNSMDNPFYGEGSLVEPEPIKHASKRRKISIPGEEDQTIEEAEQRDDGFVYVFRGKKMFRKFENEEDDFLDEDAGNPHSLSMNGASSSRSQGPSTRSSLKPRLLFPSTRRTQQMDIKAHRTEDEEADTDIEEPLKSTSTPSCQLDGEASTPTAPRFAPASPPTTLRATRSRKVDMSSSPAAPISDNDEPQTPTARAPRRTKISPFDTWQRSKGSSSDGSVGGAGKKRQGVSLDSGAAKKLRN